jgi:hypothetical protein
MHWAPKILYLQVVAYLAGQRHRTRGPHGRRRLAVGQHALWEGHVGRRVSRQRACCWVACCASTSATWHHKLCFVGWQTYMLVGAAAAAGLHQTCIDLLLRSCRLHCLCLGGHADGQLTAAQHVARYHTIPQGSRVSLYAHVGLDQGSQTAAQHAGRYMPRAPPHATCGTAFRVP